MFSVKIPWLLYSYSSWAVEVNFPQFVSLYFCSTDAKLAFSKPAKVPLLRTEVEQYCLANISNAIDKNHAHICKKLSTYVCNPNVMVICILMQHKQICKTCPVLHYFNLPFLPYAIFYLGMVCHPGKYAKD